MKFGVQLYSLRELAERAGAEEVLRAVSDAGYDGVEFAGFYGKTPAEMKELLKKYKLEGVSAHIRPEAVEESLPFIDGLGIRYVFVPWVGPEEFASAEKYEKVVKDCAAAKKRARCARGRVRLSQPCARICGRKRFYRKDHRRGGAAGGTGRILGDRCRQRRGSGNEKAFGQTRARPH